MNPKSATAEVSVTIVRNQYAPIFLHPTVGYATVSEYEQIGSRIFDVNATDPDSEVPESEGVSIKLKFLLSP